MAPENTETTMAQAEAWRQLYESWLALMGADAMFKAIEECNQEGMEGLRNTLDPAWQIPLRWLEDMTKVIEGSHAPQPMQALALNAAQMGPGPS